MWWSARSRRSDEQWRCRAPGFRCLCRIRGKVARLGMILSTRRERGSKLTSPSSFDATRRLWPLGLTLPFRRSAAAPGSLPLCGQRTPRRLADQCDAATLHPALALNGAALQNKFLESRPRKNTRQTRLLTRRSTFRPKSATCEYAGSAGLISSGQKKCAAGSRQWAGKKRGRRGVTTNQANHTNKKDREQ